MHITEWNPKDYDDVPIRDVSRPFYTIQSLAYSVVNIAAVVRRKEPKQRWSWRSHGRSCKCGWCDIFNAEIASKERAIAKKRLWFSDTNTKIEISVISSDGVENEIELLTANNELYRGHGIMHRYELTDWQLTKLLQLKSPYTVPPTVVDATTFFEAFRCGKVRSA